ncbi:MAG TPA: hypothetical protein PLR92_00750, partial [Alicycliphilus denitrificans]|nr:hypothetical protein [Alicycliphilus denitrificans]
MAIEDALAAMDKAQNAFNQTVASASGSSFQPWSESLVKYLSISVLGFMMVSLILCTTLLWRRNAEASEILRIFGILSIVGLSALLLITGFSNEQLTPIVGL